MNYEDNAICLEILIKLYNLEKPVHYSVFLEESLGRRKSLLVYAQRLKKKGLVKNPVVYNTGKETPLFYELSNSGKKLIERIIENFPVKK